MEDITWVEEYNGQIRTPATNTKRKVRPKRFEFVGWGSRQLIEFLESIGEDTSNKISQYDVTDIMNKYVLENNLMHPVKKKRIACDERLLSLFGRKTISRIKIYDLLEAHYTENRDDSDFDFLYSSDDEQRRSLPSEKKTNLKKKVVQTPTSCFPAIVSDNIKLVYLRRSLVLELVKEPDTFEGKMMGSFVRIKSDPNDYLQKNTHQLVQVTGVKKAHGTDDFLLQVTTCIKDIRISMLSDDNFTQEECEDLGQRIKDGLLKRLTVVEMQDRARSLHEDVTKHWLARELASLQRLIDRANEKGWRRELFDYLEKRELLQKPEEQSRLLSEVPEIIAEELEAAPKKLQDDEEQQENGSQIPSPKAAPEIPKIPNDREQENGLTITSLQTGQEIRKLRSVKKQQENGSVTSSVQTAPKIPTCDISANGTFPTWISFGKESADDKCRSLLHEDQKQLMEIISRSSDEKLQVNIEKAAKVSQVPLHIEKSQVNEGFQVSFSPQVIELSDDDEETEDQKGVDQNTDDHDIVSLIWYYSDPQGHTQGPFSLSSLKRWSDADYFPPDFRVWKMGQSQEKAVLLNSILYRIFPCLG